ncbi:helix-turn-helix domain-containing protein [Tellurirhabdus bombi]|uniref:helix-turn-helix domain-containing protein n=1 Tax=Tellurirhabdus bombi TaxID=2907205 RepID=UPI001F43F2F0|nr:helix-turn-helix domain-containing protein [Tellurirhabdus bombi]
MRSIELHSDQIQLLRQIIQAVDTPPQLVNRCQCILFHHYGMTVSELVEVFSVHRRTIYNWLNRFEEGGIERLMDQPGRGNKPIAIPEPLFQELKQRAKAVGISKAYREMDQHLEFMASFDTIRRRLKSGN